MRIDGLQNLSKAPQSNQRADPARQKKPGRAADVVELSQRAKEVADLAAAAKEERVNPRIEEVRARVASGFYDSEPARKRIADSLLRSGNVREVVDEISLPRAAKELAGDDTRQDRIAEARQRVGSGFYDTPEVRGDTAQRILDELA